MVKVSFTADKYTEESLELGDSAENGYVDLSWNRFQIMGPEDEAVTLFDTRKEAERFIEDSLGEVERSGDTFYATDSQMDGEGNRWNYAGHISE